MQTFINLKSQIHSPRCAKNVLKNLLPDHEKSMQFEMLEVICQCSYSQELLCYRAFS